jgi:5-methylcytosine-specific restriction protein B
MARLTKSQRLEPVINAAQEWVRNSLIADNSVFSSAPLWTPENVAEVRSAFVDHPDEGKDDFSTKLKGRMAAASPSAKRLMAEMVWALLLFPSNIKVSTKRHQIGEIWSMSGEKLGERQLPLSDEVLAGIGSGGPGFNTHRWREMAFLISLVEDLKKRLAGERQKLMSDYEAFIEWIAQVPQDGHRQLRHMLRFFCFPDRVERMSSNRERWAVLAGFGVAAEKEAKNWTDRKLDDALLTLRRQLEVEHPDETLDFYETPLKQRWKQTEEDEPETGANRRFWVEKTIVKNRPDRQTGEDAFGKALWSPQRAEDGKDIYRQMREVRPGDVVFHFVDNESLTSFSIAQKKADESFVGVAGTPWAGRPAYRIPLSHHKELTPHIHRKEFLQEDRYRSAIDDLLAGSKGLFFNKEFNLNQGSYLTEAPLKLIQIWNDIQPKCQFAGTGTSRHLNR